MESQARPTRRGPRWIGAAVGEIAQRAAQREFGAAGVGEQGVGEMIHGQFG
jgi:hypothetical protein